MVPGAEFQRSAERRPSLSIPVRWFLLQFMQRCVMETDANMPRMMSRPQFLSGRQSKRTILVGCFIRICRLLFLLLTFSGTLNNIFSRVREDFQQARHSPVHTKISARQIIHPITAPKQRVCAREDFFKRRVFRHVHLLPGLRLTVLASIFPPTKCF